MGQFEMNQRAKAVGATAAWVICWGIFVVCGVGNAERPLKAIEPDYVVEKEMRQGIVLRLVHFLWQSGKSSYHHVWPEMEFGWRLVLGTIIGFLGAGLGSVGGVGGGGIFVPMLSLIIGFDPKSSTAISKCMIMGAAGSTVYYNLKLRHPTLDMPLIDYDLALLFQPMLMLGISIGVAFNVIFPDWMVTVLLIILFIGTSTKALFKGIETWKKETLMKTDAMKLLESESKPGVDSKRKTPKESEVNIKHLKLIWNLHKTIADEHIRSASYLLQYKSYTTSYTARPVEPASTPESSSSDSHIPLSHRMGKKRAPPALFGDTSSAVGAQKGKIDVPEGTKKVDAGSSKIAEKPPVAPSKKNAPADVIAISPTKTSSLVDAADRPLKRLRKSSSVNLAGTASSLPAGGSSISKIILPSSSTSSVIPEVLGVDEKIPRDTLTSLAARHLSSLVNCFNTIVKKDQAIKASTSSSDVDDALLGLTQSVKESHQQYIEEKTVWETKLAVAEADKMKMAETSKNLEEKIKDLEVKHQESDDKLKKAEEEISTLRDIKVKKEELEVKLSSEKSRRKVAIKKHFSVGWEKGWERGIAAMTSQVQYGELKYFYDGWVAALQELKVQDNSELFQRHLPGPPPPIEEEEEDEPASDESSIAVDVPISASQPSVIEDISSMPPPAERISADQAVVITEQPSSSSQPPEKVLGDKEKFVARMELISSHDTELMQQCHQYYRAGHTDLSSSEIADILGHDASEQATEAYRYLKSLLDRAVANNIAYYELIEELHCSLKDLQNQHNESMALLHEDYENRYQQLSSETGHKKIIAGYDVRERTLKGEIEACRQIAEILEQENNNLQKKLAQYESAASSSTALIPVTDEGFSFLEVENAKLRQELEDLRRSSISGTARGRGRSSRGRGRIVEEQNPPIASRSRSRVLSHNVEESRTQSTLETQAFQLDVKDRALSDLSKKNLSLEDQLTAMKSDLNNKDALIKNFLEQVDRLTFQFHKQPREFWNAGYNEALYHLDDRLENANNEGYKQGWLNALGVLKLEQGHYLWDYHAPGLLDLPVPPYKLDMAWIPARSIPRSLISKYLGDYNLHSQVEVSRPEHLLDTPTIMNVRMLKDMNFINSPLCLEDAPAGEEPVSKDKGKKPIE